MRGQETIAIDVTDRLPEGVNNPHEGSGVGYPILQEVQFGTGQQSP